MGCLEPCTIARGPHPSVVNVLMQPYANLCLYAELMGKMPNSVTPDCWTCDQLSPIYQECK